MTPSDVPGAQALEDTRVLMAVQDQLAVHLLQRLRDVEVRQLHELDALPTAGAWMETQGKSMTRRDLALGRRLERGCSPTARRCR